MRASTLTSLVVLLAGIVRPSVVFSADEVAGSGQAAIKQEKHGYWWYEVEPNESEPSDRSDLRHPELPAPPAESRLLEMHPEEVEKLISDYRQYALWKLTPEHVQWYYGLQDFARRRSTAFMNVTQYVMLTTPSLNMKTESPDNSPGVAAREATRQANINERLDRERDKAALIMFTRATCSYCKAQHNSLLYFAQRHGWEVREIDVDENPEMKARFSADYTPTTVVIFRGGDRKWFPVSVGVDTVAGIEESTYRALRMMRGETEAQSYTLQDYQQGGILDPKRGQ